MIVWAASLLPAPLSDSVCSVGKSSCRRKKADVCSTETRGRICRFAPSAFLVVDSLSVFGHGRRSYTPFLLLFSALSAFSAAQQCCSPCFPFCTIADDSAVSTRLLAPARAVPLYSVTLVRCLLKHGQSCLASRSSPRPPRPKNPLPVYSAAPVRCLFHRPSCHRTPPGRVQASYEAQPPTLCRDDAATGHRLYAEDEPGWNG